MKFTATGDGFGPDEEGHKSLFDQVARNLPIVTKTNAARKAKNPFFTQPTHGNLPPNSSCCHWRPSYSLHLHFFYQVYTFFFWIVLNNSQPSLRLPLGDSTTILFSSPVLVITLSVFLLDERCGVFRFVAASSLVLGVVLIAKPPLIFGHNKEVDGRH